MYACFFNIGESLQFLPVLLSSDVWLHPVSTSTTRDDYFVRRFHVGGVRLFGGCKRLFLAGKYGRR